MDSELQVILFDINCTIYKLNKLGKFWYIYGQLLNNNISSYGLCEKSLRRSHNYQPVM